MVLIRESLRVVSRASVLLLTFVLAGCLTAKSYVDPTLPVLSRTQLPTVQPARPVSVLFEFRTQGKANARGTSVLQGRVVAAVAESGMFGQVGTTLGDADTGVLKMVIDNQGDMGSAVAKGVGTGLTLGLAGSLVTDNYLCTASYTYGGRTVETTVQHALHTTIGNHSAPPGMTAVQPQDGVNQVVDQLVWHSLKQLAEQNAFK